jgi:hypothetical protein
MRLARLGWSALSLLLLPLLTGCLGWGTSRAQLFDRLPFLNPNPPTDSAFIEYVLIDRPAGREDINRQLWERVDEQVLNADIRYVLEENGLRVGTISDAMPGPLRSMFDDPRTTRGHRYRSFAAEKSATLYITPEPKHVAFTMHNGSSEPIKFAREQAQLGFEISVKELPDNRIHVKLVPVAKYHDPSQFIPTAKSGGIREQANESFPTGIIEVTLSATEYIVIGTEFYSQNTFGNVTFVGDSSTLERAAQRVLVLRAGLTKAERSAPKMLNGKDDPSGTLPIASQASVARGQKP